MRHVWPIYCLLDYARNTINFEATCQYTVEAESTQGGYGVVCFRGCSDVIIWDDFEIQ